LTLKKEIPGAQQRQKLCVVVSEDGSGNFTIRTKTEVAVAPTVPDSEKGIHLVDFLCQFLQRTRKKIQEKEF
jgi:hypothetical protein